MLRRAASLRPAGSRIAAAATAALVGEHSAKWLMRAPLALAQACDSVRRLQRRTSGDSRRCPSRRRYARRATRRVSLGGALSPKQTIVPARNRYEGHIEDERWSRRGSADPMGRHIPPRRAGRAETFPVSYFPGGQAAGKSACSAAALGTRQERIAVATIGGILQLRSRQPAQTA